MRLIRLLKQDISSFQYLWIVFLILIVHQNVKTSSYSYWIRNLGIDANYLYVCKAPRIFDVPLETQGCNSSRYSHTACGKGQKHALGSFSVSIKKCGRTLVGKSISSTNSFPSPHHLVEEWTGFEAVGLYFEKIYKKGIPSAYCCL